MMRVSVDCLTSRNCRERVARTVTVFMRAALAGVLAACTASKDAAPPDRQAADSSGVLVAVDSSIFTLPEGQTGRLQGVVAGVDGRKFLLLRRPDAVVLMDAAARADSGVRRLEFTDSATSLVDAVVVDDSSGFALGYPTGEILRWHVGDGGDARSSYMSLDSGSTAIANADGRITVVRVERDRGLVTTTARGDSTVHRDGILRDVVARTPRASSLFGKVAVAASDSVIAVATELSNVVYLIDPRTAHLDSIRITRSTRRGARDDLARLIYIADSSSAPDSLLAPSSLSMSAISPDGMLLTVYVDQEMRGKWLGARAYLHVTQLETGQQCGDIEIPGALFPVRRFVIAAGRLVALQPEVEGKAMGERRIRIVEFDVHLERCSWSAGDAK